MIKLGSGIYGDIYLRSWTVPGAFDLISLPGNPRLSNLSDVIEGRPIKKRCSSTSDLSNKMPFSLIYLSIPNIWGLSYKRQLFLRYRGTRNTLKITVHYSGKTWKQRQQICPTNAQQLLIQIKFPPVGKDQPSNGISEPIEKSCLPPSHPRER